MCFAEEEFDNKYDNDLRKVPLRLLSENSDLFELRAIHAFVCSVSGASSLEPEDERDRPPSARLAYGGCHTTLRGILRMESG